MTSAKTNIQSDFYPAALTIAGSDSGGGAGIQADLRTFSAFGVFGCSAITAVTAQNPLAVNAVMPVAKNMLSAQIDSVCSKIPVRAMKSGMLCNAELISELCDCLKALDDITYVVDPVMVSGSGAKLLEDGAVKMMQESLLKYCNWLTPNIPEAEILCGQKINNSKDMHAAAQYCAKKYQCSCLLKGGHSSGEGKSIDIVAHNDALYELSSPKITCDELSTHGTGCTLSAAMTAAFALAMPWKKALQSAKGFVFGSLAEALKLSDEINAMYPPQDYYANQIKLKRL